MTTDERAGQRFGRTRMRPGYRVEDVDALMARAEAGELTAAELERATFASVRAVSGYDEQEVDAALDDLVRQLRGERLSAEDSEPEPTSWWSRLLGGR